MSVSGISSSGSNPPNWQSSFNKVKTDFQSLAQALQSGNLTDAQQAFATLQKDLPAKAQQAAASDPNSPLNTLGQALQSGDLSAAQTAFTALQQARPGHHHHHHAASEAAAPAVASTSSSSDDTTVGASLDAIA